MLPGVTDTLPMIDAIVGVARVLMGLASKLAEGNQARRERMADFFISISDCLAAVSSELRQRRTPHGKCAEMRQYAEALERMVADEVGAPKARELATDLMSAYQVERLSADLRHAASAEVNLDLIDEASGKFRALANMVRVGV